MHRGGGGAINSKKVSPTQLHSYRFGSYIHIDSFNLTKLHILSQGSSNKNRYIIHLAINIKYTMMPISACDIKNAHFLQSGIPEQFSNFFIIVKCGVVSILTGIKDICG